MFSHGDTHGAPHKAKVASEAVPAWVQTKYQLLRGHVNEPKNPIVSPVISTKKSVMGADVNGFAYVTTTNARASCALQSLGVFVFLPLNADGKTEIHRETKRRRGSAVAKLFEMAALAVTTMSQRNEYGGRHRRQQMTNE